MIQIYVEMSQEKSLCRYLKQTKLSFYFVFTQNRRTGGWNRSCLGALVAVGRGGCGERVKEGEYGANTVHTCM
jgi:hypothetical protein